MSELRERDAMNCRSCGNEERASEGYPCAGCGTFICQMCEMRGVQYCKACVAAGLAPADSPAGGGGGDDGQGPRA